MIFLPLIILATVLVMLFRWVISEHSDDHFYRWAWALFLMGCLLLFWVNGAVGIIGASNNDVNMLYNALLGVGVVAALGLRRRRLGLALLMLVLDFLMVVILAVAWIGDLGLSGPKWPYDAVVLTVFFSSFWCVAAILFYRSYRQRLRLGLN